MTFIGQGWGSFTKAAFRLDNDLAAAATKPRLRNAEKVHKSASTAFIDKEHMMRVAGTGLLVIRTTDAICNAGRPKVGTFKCA